MSAVRRDASAIVRTIPGLLAVSLFLYWAATDGGFAATTWYPGAVFLAALLLVTVLGIGSFGRPSHVSTVAITALAGYTAWSFASIAWADAKDDAWDGANRTLLYLIVVTIFSVVPWTRTGAMTLVGTYGMGLAVVFWWTIWDAATANVPSLFFIGGRLAEPIGYSNATAAVAAIATLPMLWLASRRSTPVIVRGSFIGAGTLLTAVALLAQSRGWLIGLVVALVFAFVALPGRLRFLVAVSIPLAALAALAPSTREVADAGRVSDGALHSALVDFRLALFVSVVAALLAGLGLGVVDQRFAVPARVVRVAGIAVVAAIAALACAGAVVAVVHREQLQESIADTWDDFRRPLDTSLYGTGNISDLRGATSHFSEQAVTGNRYDVWRVAWGEFRREPILGVGADNFAIDYIQERRSFEEPLYPHSLTLRAFTQTGVVGAALFFLFVSVAVAAAFRRRNAPDAIAASLLVPAIYWLVHGSIDWLWEIPAVTAPALAWLTMAGAQRNRPAGVNESDRGRTGRTVAYFCIAAGVAAAVVSFSLPGLAAREVALAAREWPGDSRAALKRLDRARELNRLADEPDVVGGAIEVKQKHYRAARSRFRSALERNPRGWYTHLELGITSALLGDREGALQSLVVAQSLNPVDPLIPLLMDDVRAGARVDVAAVDRLFLLRARGRSRGLGQPP
jgi:hypothetical protein